MAGVYRAGAIGRTGRGNFGHGLHKCYAEVPNVDIVAIADDDTEGRSKASSETGVTSVYADYREMLEKENLDIVSVCPRWVDCHEEMIAAVLESGSHVYAEKPITDTPEAADRIIDLAESKGLKIAVAHQAAYLPQIAAIKAMVDDGRIGDVRTIRSAGKQDQRGGGEDLIVLGTHLFNLMLFFVGNVQSVWGRVTVGGKHIAPCDVRQADEPVGWIAGDAVDAHYEFECGATASFESRRRSNRDGRPYGMEIIGDKGSIALRADGSDITFLDDDAHAPWEVDQNRVALDLETAPLMWGNVLAITDLVQAIEEDREPVSSARAARSALEMILGIYAAEVSGVRVPLPLEDRMHPLEVWKNSD